MTAVLDSVRRYAVPVDLENAPTRLLDAIDPAASVILIGEASHGTHEFYRIRADLTRLLIERREFGIVAVEADWPDAYRANRWVRLLGDDDTAEAALSDFTRFPRWMWRNREVVRFLRWLRGHNAERQAPARAGFYGLDLYSLHRSMANVIDYLDKIDTAAASRARHLYGCFDTFGFHDTGVPAFMLQLAGPVAEALATPRLERAIGVIYRPETERASHYFSASLADQFDLLVHIDRTRALEPLETWSRHEIDWPETYPTGI